MAVLFSWSSVPFFCLYAQSFAGLNPTIVNPGCFGFSLGSSCVCINFARKGELLITIMSSLAQEESRSISENVTWGQRKRFADGKVSMPYKRFITSFQKRRPLTVAFFFFSCAPGRKEAAEGEWLSSPFRGCVCVMLLSC